MKIMKIKIDVDIVVINDMISGIAVFDASGRNCLMVDASKLIAIMGKTPITIMAMTKNAIGRKSEYSFSSGV
jgi:hypothetical protein